MMYELEFVLLEEQRVIDHASRQQRHDTNLSIKETYFSKTKDTTSRNPNVTQSNSQCCVPCC
ncbi:hypothetical protein H7U05_29835 [Priestia megaterium]|uniref:hypothetical protein n=1 Tax=Priestia megaterium TaxID=1404 RepID=UPI001C8EDE2B|nr:hypothetical protein [Priestia megaterium]MBY0201425.1 hypothetical protein [Priestia megaterium]